MVTFCRDGLGRGLNPGSTKTITKYDMIIHQNAKSKSIPQTATLIHSQCRSVCTKPIQRSQTHLFFGNKGKSGHIFLSLIFTRYHCNNEKYLLTYFLTLNQCSEKFVLNIHLYIIKRCKYLSNGIHYTFHYVIRQKNMYKPEAYWQRYKGIHAVVCMLMLRLG